MNERITAGAAAVMGTLTLATAAVRWAVAPSRPTVAVDDLLGPEPAFSDIDFTDVPVTGVLTQAWRPCSGSCGGDMPSVVHADGSHTCGHCFTTTTTGA